MRRKRLIGGLGLPLLPGRHCRTAVEVRAAAEAIGPCVVKAQVPAGKRGKAGGIRFAATPAEAVVAGGAIIGMSIGGLNVRSVLVEAQAEIAQEMYAAVISDPGTKGPLLVFSPDGDMDIEEVAARDPASVRRLPVDIEAGPIRPNCARWRTALRPRHPPERSPRSWVSSTMPGAVSTPSSLKSLLWRS